MNRSAFGAALVVLGMLALVALACSEPARESRSSESEGGDGRLAVYAVNYPLQYLAARIAGPHADVVLPAPPGVDPAHWTPSAEEVAAFQRADLILLNGEGYAAWTRHASLPRGKRVDTAASFREQWISLTGSTVHTHGPGGNHSHTGWALTTWLDPMLAMQQARAIEQALAAARPEHADAFRENLAALEADLMTLDATLGQVERRIGAEPLLFSHPVYQYLERRYALNGRSLHWEPDVEPSETQWRELAEILAEHPARSMIWEAEPLASTRDRLAASGVEVVVYSPCFNVPERGDWLEVMRGNAAGLLAAGAKTDSSP